MQKVKSPDSVEGSEAKYWKFGWECPHGNQKVYLLHLYLMGYLCLFFLLLRYCFYYLF